MSREVIEFIIVPPFARRDEVMRAKERFIAYLGQRFPAFTFTMPGFVPVGSEAEFTIMPVMNYCDDQGQSRMCHPPKRWLVAEIEEACNAFDQGKIKTFAA